MILKSFLDETDAVWHSSYDQVSQTLAIITQQTGDTPVLRNDAALILFRAYKEQLFELQTIEYDSFVLLNREAFVE